MSGEVCKVRGCHEEKVQPVSQYRHMCLKHYATYPDGRPRCKVCMKAYACDPYVDEMCESCHPRFQVASPMERHVLDLIRSGHNPRAAVQQAMGPDTTPRQAQRKLEKISTSAPMLTQMLQAMDDAGLTVASIVDGLQEQLNAEKVTLDREGNEHSQPDWSARGQARDQALKIMGGYAPKKMDIKSDKTERKLFAVAVLPQQKPFAVDEKIIDIPIDGDE